MGMGPITPAGGDFSLAQIPGYAAGFYVTYRSSLQVYIRAGAYESDGVLFSLPVDFSHTMTSLAAGFDLHYVYLDKSESLPISGAPVFYDATTEPPARDVVRNGWYHPTNTEDRMVGVVVSPSGSATINYFDVVRSGNQIRYFNNFSDYGFLGAGMLPDNQWHTPSIGAVEHDTDVLVPVNANEVYLMLRNEDGYPGAENIVKISAVSQEYGVLHPGYGAGPVLAWNFGAGASTSWVPLGTSRKIYVGGESNDDAGLDVALYGFGYSR